MDKDSAWGALLRRYGRIFSEAWRARHEMQGLSHTREEAQFLPPILEVLETPPPLLARMIFVGGDAVFCGGGDLGDYRTHGYCGNRFRKNHSR